MQRQRSLLPTGRKRVKLPSGGVFVISRFAVGQKLNAGDRDGSEQENMNKATLVKNKLQNEPNYQQRPNNQPHLREAFLN